MSLHPAKRGDNYHRPLCPYLKRKVIDDNGDKTRNVVERACLYLPAFTKNKCFIFLLKIFLNDLVSSDHLFLLNGVHNRTVSASEDSTVEMVCQSDTWTPTRIISVVDGDRLLASRSSNEMQSGQLRYIIKKTRCEDTGDYRCEFANTTGVFYTETVRLLVPCKYFLTIQIILILLLTETSFFSNSDKKL